MLPRLAALLNAKGGSEPKTVLISDVLAADGAFLVHHFLASAVKEERPVCFLHLAQTFSHYNLVAQKLGCNLSSGLESGYLRLVDGLALSLQNTFGSVAETSDSATTTTPDGLLKHLFKTIVSTMEALTAVAPSRRRLLLIDDVSVLATLGHSPVVVAALLLQLRRRFAAEDVTFVFLLHRDVETEDEDVPSLTTTMAHAVNLHLRVDGLATGFCSDVHGRLTLIRRFVAGDGGIEGRDVVERQFKLLDRDVKLFAPGLSNAVI